MSKSSGGRCKKQSVFDFIQNTYHMVEVTDKSILDWSADGKCFVIKDHGRFVEELPKYFRHRNFRSFVRQLNFYEFRKLKADEISSRGNQKLAHYYHPSFQRGKPQLLKDIRQKAKDSEDGESVAVAELRDQVTVLKDQVLSLQQQMDMFLAWMVAMDQQLPALAAPGAAPTSGSHTDQGPSPAILSTAIPTVPGIGEPPVPPALGRGPSSSGSSASGRKRRRNANDDVMLEAAEFARWPNGGETIAAIPRALPRTRSSTRSLTAAATAAGGGGFEPISRQSTLEFWQSVHTAAGGGGFEPISRQSSFEWLQSKLRRGSSGWSMPGAASIDADSVWDNPLNGSQGVDEQLSQGSLKMARADTMPYSSS